MVRESEPGVHLTWLGDHFGSGHGGPTHRGLSCAGAPGFLGVAVSSCGQREEALSAAGEAVVVAASGGHTHHACGHVCARMLGFSLPLSTASALQVQGNRGQVL